MNHAHQVNGALRDTEGKVSSKRLVGTLLVTAGGVFLLAVGAVSIWRRVADPDTALAAGRALITSGAALLGIGVFEGAGRALRGGGGNVPPPAGR